MTLVAAFTVGRVPLLLGDILVTQLGLERASVTIPTHRELNDILPPSYHRPVVSLKRKVQIVAGNVALGWAGSPYEAAEAIARLGNFAQSSVRDRGSILDWVQKNLWHQQYAIIGLAMDEKGPCLFEWDARDARLKYQNEGHYAVGTGAQEFASLLNAGLVIEKHSNETDAAISRALAYAGELLGQESVFGEGVAQGFGGAFEIIYWNGTKFANLDHVVYVCLHASIDLGNSMHVKPIFPLVTTCHEGEYLVVHSVWNKEDLNATAEGEPTRAHVSNDVFFVEPAHCFAPAPDLSPWQLKPITPLYYNCHFSSIFDEQRLSMSLCLPEPNDFVRFRWVGSQQGLEFNTKYSDSLHAHLAAPKAIDAVVGELLGSPSADRLEQIRQARPGLAKMLNLIGANRLKALTHRDPDSLRSARDVFTAAIIADPSFLAAQTNLGLCYRQLAEVAKDQADAISNLHNAQAALETVLAVESNNQNALKILLYVFWQMSWLDLDSDTRQNVHQKAVTLCERATANDQNDGELGLLAAVLQIDYARLFGIAGEGTLRAALELLDQFASTNPLMALAYSAVAHHFLGNAANARLRVRELSEQDAAGAVLDDPLLDIFRSEDWFAALLAERTTASSSQSP